MAPAQQLLHLILLLPLAENYDSSTFEAVQLEDGSTAYIHRPVIVPPGSTVLEVQAEAGLEELAGEEEDDAFDVETINALKPYASKVRMRAFFHGLPAVLRDWCTTLHLAWSLSCLLSFALPCVSFTAVPTLGREARQGFCESASPGGWLTRTWSVSGSYFTT